MRARLRPVLVALVLPCATACGVPSYAFDSLDAAFDGDVAGPDVRVRLDAHADAHESRGDASRDGKVDATRRDAGHDAAHDAAHAGRDAGRDAAEDSEEDSRHVADSGHDARHRHDASRADAGGCSGSCAPSPPDGWAGPVALYEGAGTAPACTGAYDGSSYQGKGGLSDPAASCSECQCGAVTSDTCSTSITDLGTGCGTNCDATLTLDDGACVQIPSSPSACQSPGVAFDGNPVTGGASCAASGGAPTGAAPAFATAAAACSPGTLPRSTCSASEVCAPAPPAAFGDGLCISSTGESACPTGSMYSVQHVFYAGFSDQRTCSGCACASAGCGGTIAFFADTGCVAGIGTIAPDGPCAGPEPDMTAMAVMYQASPSCSPSGGSPSGSVVGTSPTTFCCLP